MEWRLWKIILVARTEDRADRGARWADVDVLGPGQLCAVSALGQGAD